MLFVLAMQGKLFPASVTREAFESRSEFLPGVSDPEALILAQPLRRIDYQHFHRSLARFEFQPQVRQGAKHRWAIGARRIAANVFKRQIVFAREPSLIDYRNPNCASRMVTKWPNGMATPEISVGRIFTRSF